MKHLFNKLLNHPLLKPVLGGLIAYLCFVIVILATLQVPPEVILESGLREVILVFEG